MTLGDYVDLVCTKVHRTDEPSRDEARKYIASRYQMIYESYPWRDACEVAGIACTATQTVILPHIADRVIGCRWGSSGLTLRNENLWTILQIDPGAFDRMGDPVSYTIYSPSAVHTAPPGQQIAVQTTTASPNFMVSVYGSYLGADKNETIRVTGTVPIVSVNRYDTIYTLSKYDNSHDLTVRAADTSEELLYLNATEQERKHQRLHLHSIPNNATTALVLYKRQIKPLINDSDAPEIAGIDNALLSCAIADMRESERQYAKSAAKLEEGVLLVKTMADLERHQSESVVRLIPIISDNEDFVWGSDKSFFLG